MSAAVIDATALCASEAVGAGSRIEPFARIAAAAVIGRDCRIASHAVLAGAVSLGDGVVIETGAFLCDGLRLENGVFVGPNAVFTDTRFPRAATAPARRNEGRDGGTVVRQGASVGAGAVILPGVEIGANAMVGAGAVVTKSVPPNGIVAGNPARIIGYADTAAPPASPVQAAVTAEGAKRTDLGVGGAALHRLRRVHDLRGSLVVDEVARDLPFTPRRWFVIFDVPTQEVRGEHAHKECHQFLVCLRGSVGVLVDDGARRQSLVLDRPDLGLYMPPRLWGSQYRYSADAVMLVLASHLYDPADYLRSYDDFLAFVRAPAPASA